MNTTSSPLPVAIALALTLSTGCIRDAQQASRVTSDGSHTVQLSTDENLLPELETYAEDAGCKLSSKTSVWADGFGSFVAHCPDRLLVSQRHDVLRFRCFARRGDACDALMLRLAPPMPRRRF